MDCRRIKEYLEENFQAAGYDLPAEIEEHIDACPDCRAYFEELISLGRYLHPAVDIAMTSDEAARFELQLNEGIEAVDSGGRPEFHERKIFSIARMALAAAAVLVIMLTSYNPNKPTGLAILNNSNAWQLAQISTDDMTPLLQNSSADILPAAVDDNSATYLTEEIQPWQADNILETATSEELEWLQKNLTLEI